MTSMSRLAGDVFTKIFGLRRPEKNYTEEVRYSAGISSSHCTYMYMFHLSTSCCPGVPAPTAAGVQL